MRLEWQEQLPEQHRAVVEFRLEDPKVPILNVHRMSIAQVKMEMAPHKELKHAKTLNHLPWQHVIIFEKLEAKKDEPK